MPPPCGRYRVLARRVADLADRRVNGWATAEATSRHTPIRGGLNFFSAAVAVPAGIVGVVSPAEARTSALLGVFISVTTIPAAAGIGVSSAFAGWDEAWGSLLRLPLDIVVLIVVGTATLKGRRAIWRRVGERRHERAVRGQA